MLGTPVRVPEQGCDIKLLCSHILEECSSKYLWRGSGRQSVGFGKAQSKAWTPALPLHGCVVVAKPSISPAILRLSYNLGRVIVSLQICEGWKFLLQNLLLGTGMQRQLAHGNHGCPTQRPSEWIHSPGVGVVAICMAVGMHGCLPF